MGSTCFSGRSQPFLIVRFLIPLRGFSNRETPQKPQTSYTGQMVRPLQTFAEITMLNLCVRFQVDRDHRHSLGCCSKSDRAESQTREKMSHRTHTAGTRTLTSSSSTNPLASGSLTKTRMDPRSTEVGRRVKICTRSSNSSSLGSPNTPIRISI